MKGGIAAWDGLKAYGPVEIGMAYLKGDEKPAEVVILAYGMEAGLAELYSKLALNTGEPDLSSLLRTLAGIEEIHKEKLFELYVTLDRSVNDKQKFEAGIVSKVMEGGVTTEEFMEQNKEAMSTRGDVLSMAMMLEAQSLDLYMRYSQRSEDPGSKGLFYHIAEEEKAHLASLGRMMEVEGK